jgi:hypothetical protein
MSHRLEQPAIDPVARLSILAAALPGAALRQRRIAAAFDAVWHLIADLEHATPRYEPGVARVNITGRQGERLQLLVRNTEGREERMDGRLRPGWCLMQSPTIVIAFAARPLNGQTVLAHLEHRRAAAQIPGPSQSRQHRAACAKIDQELHSIESLVTQVSGRA